MPVPQPAAHPRGYHLADPPEAQIYTIVTGGCDSGFELMWNHIYAWGSQILERGRLNFLLICGGWIRLLSVVR